MSTNNSGGKRTTKTDTTFESLVEDTEARIREYQAKINNLRKSLVFFKKQSSSGVQLPALGEPRHEKIS